MAKIRKGECIELSHFQNGGWPKIVERIKQWASGRDEVEIFFFSPNQLSDCFRVICFGLDLRYTTACIRDILREYGEEVKNE